MKREEKKQKENRIARSLREYMINRVLERENKGDKKEHIDLPVCVLQNLVWNKNITSGKDLQSENFYFKCSSSKYQPVHSVSTNVLTSKYIRPALNRINQQVADETIKHKPSNLSFPYKVELITSKDGKISFYRFSPYKELSTALRLYTYFEDKNLGTRTLEELSLSQITFHTLLQSDIRSVEWHINEYKSTKNPMHSVAEHLEYTSNHVIPVLNHLNQIAEEKKKNIRYTLGISYSPQPNGYQATYNFHRKETPNDTDNSAADNYTHYYSTKKTEPIYYYKMSKWAYMLHVFLFHIYQQESFCKATVTYGKSTIKNTIVELDAKKVWDYWYLIPHDDTNQFLTEEEKKKIEERGNERTSTGKKKTGITSPHTSFYNEFEKAIKEINTLYTLKMDGNQTKKGPILFLFPCKTHTTCPKLYHSYKNQATGKYYVQINTELFEDMKKNKYTSKYYKAYAYFFPKTNYSQMRFLEYLLEALPYNDKQDTDIQDTDEPHTNISPLISYVPMLSIITGKFDISDNKIKKLFSYLNQTDQPEETLFTNCSRPHSFSYLFYELFVKETIIKLNKRLQVLGITKEYEADLNQYPYIPFIEFSLLERKKEKNEQENKEAP